MTLPILKQQIASEQDVVFARQQARRIAGLLGFDGQDQIRLATVVSELARNVYQYARTGTIEYVFRESDNPQVFEIRVSDRGPGITNPDHVLGGSYVSKTGMGVGLGGSQRLMDEFDLKTSSEGTQVTVAKSLSKRAKRLDGIAIGALGKALGKESLPTPFQEITNQNTELLRALSEMRNQQIELAELNRELTETNRGVVALYAELDEKATSLQRANEIKTSFLSNMTHEFRTPLASIVSMARILIDRLDGDLTSEQERQVTYIRKSAEGLLEMVSDLLDLAKVEAGKVAIKATEFEAFELLVGLRAVFRPLLANAENVELVVEAEQDMGKLRTDEGKVAQILRNLVSNAIKYSERGRVELYMSLTGDEEILFSVKDEGIGIAEENLELIFQDFTQIDSDLQKRSRGTGLGLPLSRKLARLLGGDLWVESQLGKGSTFYVKIPRDCEGRVEGQITGQSSVAPSGAMGSPWKTPEARL